MPPYPLTPGNSSGGDSRERLMPPLGCPGEPELVWPVDAAEWLALGYRRVAVQPAPLELSWLPEACTPGSLVIWLVLRCQSSPPAAITVQWGDGSSETVAWPSANRWAWLALLTWQGQVPAGAVARIRPHLPEHCSRPRMEPERRRYPRMREVVFHVLAERPGHLEAQADTLPIRITAPTLEELQHEAREALIEQMGPAHCTVRVRVRRGSVSNAIGTQPAPRPLAAVR